VTPALRAKQAWVQRARPTGVLRVKQAPELASARALQVIRAQRARPTWVLQGKQARALRGTQVWLPLVMRTPELAWARVPPVMRAWALRVKQAPELV
jgi:hypothetical protein